ncbi:MFS transporter [Paracoccus yeei]|uniref:MFS transporter n=1 Tax=Paracoccus yeei TaxID=147645 RepID=UPI00174CDA1D|nr:MFS transporter [Paracoccus yeei]
MPRGAKPARPAAILSLGGLYVAQSVLAGFIWTTLPAVWRSQGTDIQDLGWLSLLILPWALKFLWSPLVERWRRPPDGRVWTRRMIAAGLIAILSALPLLLFDLPPAGFFVVLLAITTVTATVDIACDGHAVEAFPSDAYPWVNMMQVGGAYLGAACGGGLLLVVIDRAGFDAGMGVLAGLCAVLMFPFLLRRQPAPCSAPAPQGQSLRAALARPDFRRGLLVAALFVVAMKSMMGLYGPFLVDLGASLSRIGSISATGGLIAGLVGASCGGILVARFGSGRVLAAAMLVQGLILAACLATAAGAAALIPAMVSITQIAGSGGLALGFVALYAKFMEWSDPSQGGVDFTLLQSADAAVSMGLGLAATQIAARLGYPVAFSLALAATATCALLLRRMITLRR